MTMAYRPASYEQIKSILAGAEESLRLLQSQPEYQAIEQSEGFATPNDLVLGIENSSDRNSGTLPRCFHA